MEDFKWDDEDADRVSQLRFIDDSGKIEIPVCKIRMDICKACPDLKLNFCVNCGCYMPLKSRLRGSKCPKDKWPPEI
jgi:hypothetical protein